MPANMPGSNKELNDIIRNMSLLVGGSSTQASQLGYQAKINYAYNQSQRLRYATASTQTLGQTAITFSALAPTSFTATWTAVPTAVEYVVGIGTQANGSDSAIQTVTTLLTYNFASVGPLVLSSGITYYVTITAISSSGSTSNTINSVVLPATDPTVLGANLVAWYDATDQSSLNLTGTLVNQWNDKSGNAHHLTSTGASRPVNNTSGGANNKAFINFVGGFRDMSVAIAQAVPFGFFFVMKANSTYIDQSTAIWYTIHGYDSVTTLQQTVNSIVYKDIHGTNNAQYSVPQVGFDVVADQNWNVWEARFNGAADNYLNKNDTYTTSSSASGTNSTTQLKLGDDINVGSMFMYSEVIMVSGTPTQAQRLAVRAYLMNKYAITPVTSPTPPNPYLVAFGDSITYGENATVVGLNNFVSLAAAAKGYAQANFGSPGSEVYQSSTASLNFVTQLSQGFNPVFLSGHVFIQYGTNDSQASAVATQAWIDIYTQAIQKLINYGFQKSKIILGTQPYQPTNRPTGITFVNAAQGIAAALGIQFFNAWTYMQANGGESLLSGDLLHPTDAGHAVYATGLLPYIL